MKDDKQNKTSRKGHGKNGCLVSADMRSLEERKRLGSLGGKKAQECNKKRRNAQEIMQLLLNCKISQEQAREKLGEYAEYLPEDATIYDVVNFRQIMESMDGNVKAAEYVRDTSGDKPTERQEITATITENEKALLEKVSKRMGITETDG